MRWLREEETGEGAGGGSLLDTGGTDTGQDTAEGSTPVEGSAPAAPAKQEEYRPFSIYGESGVREEFVKTLDATEDKALINFFKKYQGAEDPNKAFLQGIKNLQYMAGQKALEPLPEDAPDSVKQERAALMRKLSNAPDSPDGYGLAKPENLPQGVYWPEEASSEYAAILHKHGASPALAKELMDRHMQTLTEAQQAAEVHITKTRDAELGKLKAEFGDRTSKVIEDAKRGAAKLGLSVEEMDSIATSASAVKALARVMELTKEDRTDPGSQGLGLNYREQAIDMMNNQSNPWFKALHDPTHPQHEEAVRRRSELNRMALEKGQVR